MRFKIGSKSVEMIEDGDRVCAHIAKGETFEPQSLKAWADLCAKGGNVIDVGAYTGLFSISAALYRCNVIAFEPMPFNADRLDLNAKLNKVRGEITIYRAAVADYEDIGEITWNPKIPFTSGASLVRRKGERMAVQVTTIDALMLDQVTAIKIDVEHGEPQVLAGARETIKRCKPALLVEVLDDATGRAILDELNGYEIAAELDRIDRPRIDARVNWLLMPC